MMIRNILAGFTAAIAALAVAGLVGAAPASAATSFKQDGGDVPLYCYNPNNWNMQGCISTGAEAELLNSPYYSQFDPNTWDPSTAFGPDQGQSDQSQP